MEGQHRPYGQMNTAQPLGDQVWVMNLTHPIKKTSYYTLMKSSVFTSLTQDESYICVVTSVGTGHEGSSRVIHKGYYINVHSLYVNKAKVIHSFIHHQSVSLPHMQMQGSRACMLLKFISMISLSFCSKSDLTMCQVVLCCT